MRQRLGIAGALLADPPVLMFDEPANGLDPEGIRWMRELLRGHAARGGTVLLSSHLLGEVEHTVDRLVVIGAGRIVADGPIGELLGRRRRAGPRARPGRAGRRPVGRPASTCSPAPSRPRCGVTGATAEQVGAVAAAGGHVLTDLRPAERGLEDALLPAHRRLTRRPLRHSARPEETAMTAAVLDRAARGRRPPGRPPRRRWPG